MQRGAAVTLRRPLQVCDRAAIDDDADVPRSRRHDDNTGIGDGCCAFSGGSACAHDLDGFGRVLEHNGFRRTDVEGELATGTNTTDSPRRWRWRGQRVHDGAGTVVVGVIDGEQPAGTRFVDKMTTFEQRCLQVIGDGASGGDEIDHGTGAEVEVRQLRRPPSLPRRRHTQLDDDPREPLPLLDLSLTQGASEFDSPRRRLRQGFERCQLRRRRRQRRQHRGDVDAAH